SFIEGRSLFAVLGLPLDDALPPLVAGGLLCAAWALRGVGLGSLGAVPHRRLLCNALMLA
ncbi:unnamed protein product, partial [Ectocarpus sp. 13 AM-2016]